MQIISNGVYRAPDHRAVANKSKERQSIVTFCYPTSSKNLPSLEVNLYTTPSPWKSIFILFTIESLKFLLA
uniref:Isopenicillin N synthase-like Fe(2+) 2OG dioxygenase domain-containing protein n=1 Tax=Populus trichocarpa TaxID=3694 RepID=A0A3N7EK69_POPTR